MGLTTQQWHIDEPLSNVSVDYTNMDYVAEEFFPVVPIPNKTGYFYQFSKEKFDVENTNAPKGSDYTRITLDQDKKGYFISEPSGLEFQITDEDRENADPGASLEIQGTKTLTEKVLLQEEYNLPTNVLSSSQLSSLSITNTTLSGTSQWSDYINSDPITVIDNAKITVANQIGRYPNSMVFSDYGAVKLRNHPRVIERVKYTGNGVRQMISESELKDLLGLDNLYIAKARYNTANPGVTTSLGAVWGKNAYLFYRPKSPALMEPAFGYTFMWLSGPFKSIIRRYREERRNSDILQIKKYYTQQVVTPGAAYVWLNAWA